MSHGYDRTGKRDGRFWSERCACGTTILGRGRAIYARHCTTCHADQHLACLACGACLPSTARADRRTCSDACRQRLHRHPDNPRACYGRADTEGAPP